MQDVELIIPVAPLSQNHVYKRGANKNIYMTEEGHDYKTFIGWKVKEVCKLQEPMTGKVMVKLILYMPNNCMDGHNAEKLIFDALQGIVYKNDRQVVAHYCESRIDKVNPRIELAVYPA